MEQLCDENVTLVADGRHFLCKKGKLIASSDYFRAMFSNNFTEKDKDVIKLEDTDADCLQILIQYAESGTYNVSDDNMLALLQTAAMLQFSDIQLECEKEVFASLSCESCLEVYSITSSLGLSNIAVSARTIALWNFRKISTMSQFLQLSLDALVEYVSDPALFTGPGGEWIVWEAIINWIQENEIERACHIMHLLQCLDFQSLTADDISNMLFYQIVSESSEVVQVLECIRKYKRDLTLGSKDLARNEIEFGQCYDETIDGEKMKIQKIADSYINRVKRKDSLTPSVIGFKRLNSKRRKKAKNSDDEDDCDISSSFGTADLVPVLYTFNPKTRTISEEFSLTKLYNGPVPCSGYQVCSMGPSVYILGGEFQLGYGNWNASLWRYSTVSKKWIIEDSLPKPRRHHMSCIIDSVIYIIGGFGRHRVVQSSVNAYDTESGEWISCPDMPHCISHGAACSFKGRLMVFTHEMQLLTYYPSMKKWSAIPLRSPSKHGYRDAVTWGNNIYLIDNCSSKVYKYSPEEGQTVTEYGSFMAPPINVCIVDGKMYNFGHDDLDSHVIEVLNIDDDGLCSIKGSSFGDQKSKVEPKYDNSKVDKESKKLDKHELIVSEEIWRESEDGPHIFTTKYPPDTTFSLGCFPLMKL